MASASDARWMREALRLAARARGRTAPNPPVGAIVVRANQRIASGYHLAAGREHAEALALARAGKAARGTVLYLTLEPCAHWGQTPPCVEAVLASGVRRVVCGMRDPDPRTSGRSLRRLRRAGIAVEVGVEEEACRELIRGFAARVTRGWPYTELKLAASLDGRIATRSGESRWITGPQAQARVHRLRSQVDAIAVGSQTVLADDPELTARRGDRVLHRPQRIAIDSRLVIPTKARLLQEPGAWILTRRGVSEHRARALERAGAELVRVRQRGAHLDLRAAWRALGSRGVNHLLVEGGGGLAAALLQAQLVDRLHLVLAPILLGSDGRAVLAGLGVERLADAPKLAELRVERAGRDLWLVAEC